MFWPLFLVVGVVASFWLSWRYKHRRMIRMARKIPGPTPLPLIGNAHQFICQPEDLIKVIKKLMEDYGDVARFWLGPDLNFVISNPEDLKVLLSTSRTSTKGPQYKYMADVLGPGILSGSGPQWRKHRKIATPNYGKRAIESYSDVFNSEVELLLQKLRKMGTTQFDVYKEIVKTTSSSVCQTLMGLTKEQTAKLPHFQEVIDESPTLYDIVFDRMTRWYLQIDPIFWMTNYYQQQNHFVKIITDFSLQIIKHRLEKINTLEENNKKFLMNSEQDSIVNTQLSVIDRFILSKELIQDDLVKETFTIFTSSQEASAKISSFVILMMAYHPKCQERLYNEIINIIGDEDRPVTDDDFKRMPYLEMVFKEVLRLFPIGVMLQRTVTEDIQISTCTLPAGCSFVAPIFHLHRDPRFWDRPDSFDPERFTPENIKKRNPNCYIPFSLGPMDCLGRFFGTKLVKTICVRLLREFEVTSPETYEDMRVIMAISAVSVNGYPVSLHRRKSKK
ncbi:cytochrome P450 4C1-like [Anticarsia gemmatalis]|uniref:cytochrome P450 4C1-like n=1 Tax=Anticarsia gemmatalis TaxID=129554 RepID=UPI003F75CC86